MLQIEIMPSTSCHVTNRNHA